jgi:hypothetical protein
MGSNGGRGLGRFFQLAADLPLGFVCSYAYFFDTEKPQRVQMSFPAGNRESYAGRLMVFDRIFHGGASARSWRAAVICASPLFAGTQRHGSFHHLVASTLLATTANLSGDIEERDEILFPFDPALAD